MKIVPDFFFEEGVAAIIRVFKKHGLANEARVVGGSVRDALLGRPCNDIDFATTQTPQEVTELFEGEGFSVEPTGIDHGTVTVIWNHHPYEITTLRQDVETDGRRAVVAFTKDWREDAERRDFTVNALYLDFDGEVHDPWGNDFGFENLLDRNLVFVGNAETRIREDALRIVRMYRFMSTLEFTADHSARAACKKLAHLINGLSGERLEKEITKLVEGPGVITAITAMIEDGVFEAMFGFKADVRVADRFRTRADFGVLISGLNLLWGWDVAAAEKVCERWKTSHAVRKATVTTIQPGPISLRADMKEIWIEAHKHGVQPTIDRMWLTWIDTWRDLRVPISYWSNQARQVQDVPFFPIRGQDLIDAGMKPSKEIGQRLKEIEAWWIETGFPDEISVRSYLKEIIAN